jgi:hypothetical protein
MIDGTLISGMSFEILAFEDFSATRLTATRRSKKLGVVFEMDHHAIGN